MAFTVPAKMGIGANCEKFTGQEIQKYYQAVNGLKSFFAYSWGRLAVGPNYMPAIYPEAKGVAPASELIAWKNAMIAAGHKWDELTWTICNEPEDSGKSPRQIATLFLQQLIQLDLANIRARFIYPNNNINTDRSFNFGVEVFQRTRQAGVLISPGVHVWVAPEYFNQIWSRYRNFIAGYGQTLSKVIITECGPGAMEPISRWLQFMPMAYRLLDDSIVGGLAPFAAYQKLRDGQERHPGFMSDSGVLNELGNQYASERRRRYGV